MASLKNIKLKILSVRKTSTVTRAMEAVSAVKMRKSQERAFSGRLYASAALSILERLAGTQDLALHPLMQSRVGKTLFVIVTSDKGLAGSLNSGVIRRTEQEIRERSLSKADVAFIGIGKRGADYFANRGYEVRERWDNLSDDVSEENVQRITNRVLAWHASREIGAVVLVYSNFRSTFEQDPVARTLVPISRTLIAEIIQHIHPARGRYVPPAKADLSFTPATFTFEPKPEKVLEQLLPKLLTIGIFHTLLESKASEHSARMVAMKNATDNARDRVKQYTRTFNKVRQAAITREISEITSGIEAMR